ncbi:response regulator transcription factor [Streptomyces pimonensis]|uniref:Response regulator transcription factor n=2 Tax=Streptomyces pimonensis TaxID=2860288 RepID=A0ABV4J6K4_9ACTN
MQVLIVDGDLDAASSLAQTLQRNGYNTTEAATGSRALEIYGEADLILLDLELPDIDGLEVCRIIRSACDTAVIAFAQGRSELDRVLGLQAGADDCLDKPYGARELLARIEAVTRRVGFGDSDTKSRKGTRRRSVSLGPLRIDGVAREVRLNGELIEMTRKEFDLLHHLASRPGKIATREELMAEVWGVRSSHGMDARASRTIDTHVSALRGKLGSTGWIVAIRGVGFRFGHG